MQDSSATGWPQLIRGAEPMRLHQIPAQRPSGPCWLSRLGEADLFAETGATLGQYYDRIQRIQSPSTREMVPFRKAVALPRFARYIPQKTTYLNRGPQNQVGRGVPPCPRLQPPPYLESDLLSCL